MKDYLIKNRRFLGFVGALFAIVIASVYLVVVPKEAADSGIISKNILLYGHSICWIFLSATGILWGINKYPKLRSGLAYAALAVYVLFVGTLFVVRFF